MARRVVKLPDIGEGTTEAEIVAWHVKVGDVIGDEDTLAEVMTDKATVEIPSPVAGTIVALNGKVGEKLAVGSDFVVIETDAANAAATPIAAAPPPTADRRSRPVVHIPTATAQEVIEVSGPPSPHPPAAAQPVPPLPHAGEGKRGKPLASPAVRKQAWDLGIELQFVAGSGPGGRITHKDIDAYAGNGARPTGKPGLGKRDGVEDIAITGLRRAIAEHMQNAARHIPHFAYVEEVDVTALEELRAHLNDTRRERGHLTLLPFLIRAMVNAVVDHPQVNARFDDEAGVLHRHRAVHIGVATQIPGGLMVPVVRHAEAFDLWQAAAEVQRLSEAARGGKATREELTGSTITITSLGRLGGLMATPVINHPEVAIIGINRIDERPVVRGGQVVIRKMMNVSSSFDHRIVDGWEAASFIAQVKGYLEQPAMLFID